MAADRTMTMEKGETMKRFMIFGIVLLCCLSVSSVWGGDAGPAKPSPKDKCPVCGMFVAKYPDFLAAIRYRDGSRFFFDGAKDMFKYYFDIEKYHPARKQSDIEAVYVTDYYNLSPTNAYEATYIVGSDIYGPMGRELIPFESETDAEEFMKDHKGNRILRFKNIKPSVIDKLD
jgi:copper chaperone NosL